MARILIVEDEKPINDLIKWQLSAVGHTCDQVYDGEAAVAATLVGEYDLVLLDVMLPKKSGFEVIREIGSVPVIFLTARSRLEDRVTGLRLGADDYIVKPFEPVELLARVDALLRRIGKGETKVSFDDLEMDFAARKVLKGGVEIPLRPKEYELLATLVRNRNIALSRERLIELVWSWNYEGDTRTVDVHIQQLRKKLGLEKRLKTIFKTGYRLEI